MTLPADPNATVTIRSPHEVWSCRVTIDFVTNGDVSASSTSALIPVVNGNTTEAIRLAMDSLSDRVPAKHGIIATFFRRLSMV